jgi:hypothetical protein
VLGQSLQPPMPPLSFTAMQEILRAQGAFTRLGDSLLSQQCSHPVQLQDQTDYRPMVPLHQLEQSIQAAMPSPSCASHVQTCYASSVQTCTTLQTCTIDPDAPVPPPQLNGYASSVQRCTNMYNPTDNHSRHQSHHSQQVEQTLNTVHQPHKHTPPAHHLTPNQPNGQPSSQCSMLCCYRHHAQSMLGAPPLLCMSADCQSRWQSHQNQQPHQTIKNTFTRLHTSPAQGLNPRSPKASRHPLSRCSMVCYHHPAPPHITHATINISTPSPR